MQPTTVPDHASPFTANPDAGVGVLLCHGFTGSPYSMKPWGRALAQEGLRVDVPRLPGHGTHWRDMAITEWSDWYRVVEQHLAVLQAECTNVFVAGLSMGGALALRLAECHDVAGVMLVNPAITCPPTQITTLRVMRHLMRSTSAIGDDIALPGQHEFAYDRTPLNAAWSMLELWQMIQDDLDKVTADVLLMTSVTDHVVDPSTRHMMLRRLPNVTDVRLQHSLHVATLDHDAEQIHAESLAFIRSHCAAMGGSR